MSATLYLVATPIGNLGDISQRAVETLANADFIAAEDTRVTRKLLDHLGIKKTLISYHGHNSRASGVKIITRLQTEGVDSCALVTDAGMPAISDPGEELVRLCYESGITVTVIPGPCAAVSALSVSGLPTGRFTFEGFLSTARKSRFEHLDELKSERRTMIFYEAPHKLLKTLNDMLSVFGDRPITISRELTKIYEETLRFTLSEAVAHFSQNPPRGEFVLVIDGCRDIVNAVIPIDDAIAAAIDYIDSSMTVKDAVKRAASDYGIAKNALYNEVIRKIDDNNKG